MTLRQLTEAKESIKKELLDLDHQIFELESYYIEDTRQFGNLLKGFDNYIAAKTARNQPNNKKPKVEIYERIFSLSSIKSKASQIYEDSFIGGQVKMQSSQAAPKRNRSRPSGMNKSSGGKSMINSREEHNQFEQDNGVSEDNGYSIDQSNVKGMPSKRKKITKNGVSTGGGGKGIRKA